MDANQGVQLRDQVAGGDEGGDQEVAGLDARWVGLDSIASYVDEGYLYMELINWSPPGRLPCNSNSDKTKSKKKDKKTKDKKTKEKKPADNDDTYDDDNDCDSYDTDDDDYDSYDDDDDYDRRRG